MPDITFDPQDPAMIGHLYNQNLILTAQVKTLSQFIIYLMDRGGVSRSMLVKLFAVLDQDNLDNLLITDPMLQAYWKNKLTAELGEIPGITV